MEVGIPICSALPLSVNRCRLLFRKSPHIGSGLFDDQPTSIPFGRKARQELARAIVIAKAKLYLARANAPNGISVSLGQEGAETCIVIPNIGFISNVLR